jgi:hypothetical protein
MGLYLTSTSGRLSGAEWQDDRQSRIGKDMEGDSNDMIYMTGGAEEDHNLPILDVTP